MFIDGRESTPGLLFQLSFHSFAGIRDGKVSGARAIRPKLITACQSLIEPSACYHLALVGKAEGFIPCYPPKISEICLQTSH